MRAVLADACAEAGLTTRDATLVRLVGNAVFRLPHDRVYVKITLTPRLAHRAGNAVVAARLLAEHGIPAVRPVGELRQPVLVGGYAVTFWHEVAGGTEPTTAELGRLLLGMHRLPVGTSGLSRWDPLPDLRHRLRDAGGWPASDLAFLAARCDAVAAALPKLRYVLPAGVVHGDARLGNLLAGPDGPVLCDFDTTGIGPVEWDLVPAAVAQLRFHDARRLHDDLAAAYGFDVTRWEGFPVLRELRELKLVASALPIAHGDPELLAQLRHRLRTFRNGDTTARWTRYR
ncbi:aminoglycoside phosphotransferase family protein [Amycolatopsis cihanbeyliensis]|uniref:phosphotransferase n=1 Tax=Amycolatopsis cihanbeyliensis TaxID=1128664 RepID=UPI001FE8A13D|nr:aminoglycoside phosphotransferase family protein [Amycolatopsis cihanbeyliensis]